MLNIQFKAMLLVILIFFLCEVEILLLEVERFILNVYNFLCSMLNAYVKYFKH